MRKNVLLVFGVLAVLSMAGCPTPNNATNVVLTAATENIGFRRASKPGDSGVITLRKFTKTLKMIYANNQESVSFPIEVDDSRNGAFGNQFWMGETEVTNAVFAAVYQWAYDHGKFSKTVSDPNGLNTTTARHGGQELVDLDHDDCPVVYDGAGVFSVKSGKEEHPVTFVSWYGAVMFCNWLTEMRDGSTVNVMYSGISASWKDTRTIENKKKNGYRLPSSEEWEYAARYRGTDTVNTVSGYAAIRYTKGNSASGATASYNEASATKTVAVYGNSSRDAVAVKTKNANALRLYDMSGNVREWCFSLLRKSTKRVCRGGSWNVGAKELRVGIVNSSDPSTTLASVGFRLCRTADPKAD